VDKNSINGSCVTCANVQNIGDTGQVPMSSTVAALAVYHVYDVDPDALVAAVDCNVIDALRGKRLRICAIVEPRWHQYEEICIIVTVTDCGYLYAQGPHTFQVRPVGDLFIARWWPGSADGLFMLVDLGPAAMRALTGGTMETTAVWITLQE